MNGVSRRSVLLLFIITAIPFQGQNPPGAAEQVATPASSGTASAGKSFSGRPVADDAVITIRGLCPEPSDSPEDDQKGCATVVTRSEFDSLLKAANVSSQQVSALSKQNLAKGYVTYLAFERAARQAGFEESPEFEEIMRWARLRAITDAYRGRIVADARVATRAEIDTYYNEHIALYDRIDVTRITIPRNNPAAPDDSTFESKALAAAEVARQRIGGGADPEQIQKDAYAALGLPGTPPVDSETRKRSNFSQEESDELFSLKTGGASKVEIHDSIYAVYKVTRHEPLEEARVEDQIARSIAEDKVKAAFKTIGDSVQPQYDPAYFGLAEERTETSIQH
jgi:hypothetical protein